MLGFVVGTHFLTNNTFSLFCVVFSSHSTLKPSEEPNVALRRQRSMSVAVFLTCRLLLFFVSGLANVISVKIWRRGFSTVFEDQNQKFSLFFPTQVMDI